MRILIVSRFLYTLQTCYNVSYQNPFRTKRQIVANWQHNHHGQNAAPNGQNIQNQSHTSNLYVGGQFNVSMFYYSWPLTLYPIQPGSRIPTAVRTATWNAIEI